MITNVEIALIKIGTRSRKVVKGVEYDRLKMSIQAKGVLIPILIDSEYRIIDGLYRFTAAKELGLTEIMAIVKPSTRAAYERIRAACTLDKFELDLYLMTLGASHVR